MQLEFMMRIMVYSVSVFIYRVNSYTCQDQWYLFGDSCYKNFNKTVNWNDALQSCRDNNASLVTISSEPEHDFVRELCNASSFTWIGYNDIEDENVWRWTIEAENSTYTAWKNGQPNNYHNVAYGSQNADCAVSRCGVESTWSDYICEFVDSSTTYTCEKDVHISEEGNERRAGKRRPCLVFSRCIGCPETGL
ncbi:C-type lectin-like [Anneissia japonica]|uniref:C-type lectin-like n=1 Tax=Anneissia japonica TaxID=1529436 RepID=UPI001425A148|nr:C-type lectin-like [Anneissia japonica]XP_033096176.1 C-type lectin-like [Anneissia japonica]XP_033096184.1 C-type lectin-like [Anneissia japonica]